MAGTVTRKSVCKASLKPALRGPWGAVKMAEEGEARPRGEMREKLGPHD